MMGKKRSTQPEMSMATGQSTRGDSEALDSSSRNNRREPFKSSQRNNTQEVTRKTPVQPKVNNRLPPHVPRS